MEKKKTATHLNDVCPIKAVYTINSVHAFLLTKHGIIGDPEIAGKPALGSRRIRIRTGGGLHPCVSNVLSNLSIKVWMFSYLRFLVKTKNAKRETRCLLTSSPSSPYENHIRSTLHPGRSMKSSVKDIERNSLHFFHI